MFVMRERLYAHPVLPSVTESVGRLYATLHKKIIQNRAMAS